jgi:hypothetical protein
MSKKLIGEISVDSGQIIIVDPAYVLKDYKEGEADELYRKTSAMTVGLPYSGIVPMSDGDAVALKTDIDGAFPVYAETASDGTIKKIIIDLQSNIPDDIEEDDVETEDDDDDSDGDDDEDMH